MPFAMTNQGGMMMSTGPIDICLTQAGPVVVPVPYPNLSQMTMTNSGTLSTKVKFAGAKAATQKTETNMSNGDEAGTNGAPVNGRNMGKCGFLKGSMKVKVEGNPAVRMGDMTKHNGQPNNAVGTATVPSQFVVNVNG